MSSKRKAENQITSDNYEENEDEEYSKTGTWQRAGTDTIKGRKIVKARRRKIQTFNSDDKESNKKEDELKAPGTPELNENNESTDLSKLPTFQFNSSSNTSGGFNFNFPSFKTESGFNFSFKFDDKKEEKKEDDKEEKKEESVAPKWTFSPPPAEPPKFNFVPLPQSTASTTPMKWPSFSFTPEFNFGSTSTSSTVTWPSFNIPTTSKNSEKKEEEGSEEGSGGEEEKSNTNTPQKEPPITTVLTGEESETTIAQARVKLYEFVKPTWSDKGMGTIKILVDPSNNKHRIVMRPDNGLRLMLNALPLENMTIDKPQERQIKFSCLNSIPNPPKLSNYWIKLTTKEDTQSLFDALEKCKQSKQQKN